LDTYFRHIGKLVHEPPLLAHPSLISTLVRTPRVHFFHGAKPRPKERRVDVSCWDLDAGAHVLTAASRACARCEFDIDHVLWHSPASRHTIRAEPWLRLLDDDQHSLVSIGSPLASLSSEVMRARMFGVEPFQTPAAEAALRLPFWYCWAPRVAGKFRSGFALTPKELQALNPDIARRVAANQSNAFGLDGNVSEVPRTGRSWRMLGMVAAQRRPAGNLWMVLSGLAGPATCAAARVVAEIHAFVPWEAHRASPVVLAPVIAQVREGPANPARGDIRELEKVELLGPPRLYTRPA
jgi:hypothetical protein